jgi:EAL domain-containing protein (putative c-di-GMP-specific phosphodiesterase class I)
MGASEYLQPLADTGFYLRHQLILARDGQPFGSETRLVMGPGVGRLSPSKLACIYSEMQMHIQLTAFLRNDPVLQSQSDVTRRFVCIAQAALADQALHEELIQGGETLRHYGQKLVVTMDEPPDPDTSLECRNKIMKHIYLMKDHGVELALDNYNPLQNGFDINKSPNLFDYIRVPVSLLEQHYNLSAQPELFDQVYEQMNSLKRSTQASIVADSVVHAENHMLARALPFDCFQGDGLVPASHQ